MLHRVFVTPLLLAAFCLLADNRAFGQPASPSPADQPVFKANSQTVVVNVVVTGRDGKPVHGLPRSAFQIAEDGHPQSLTSFEERASAATAPANLATPPRLPPNFFTNVPPVQLNDAVTVLLLDSLNTPVADQANVRAQMRRYLENPVPGRRMAIFTLGARLRLIQGFSADPAVLAATFNTLRNGSGPEHSDLLETRADATLTQTAVNQIASSDPNGGPQAAASAAALQQFFSEQATSQTGLAVAMTIDAFQQLARYLSGIPGRKNVVWFSSAFPLRISPDPDLGNSFAGVNDFQDKVRKTDAMLAAAQMAIYPVAAEGAATDSLYDVESQASAALSGQTAQKQQIKTLGGDSQQRVSNRASMEVIAKDTGGRAIFNTNGLAEALTEIASDGSDYYALSYSPTNSAEDGRYRKVEVKLSEGKYKLAYRRGYYAADAKLEKEEAAHPTVDPLAISMRPGFPDSTEVPLVLRVQQSAAKAPAADGRQTAQAGENARLEGPLTRYAADVIVAARGLQLDASPDGRQDGSRHGKIKAALVAYDLDGHPLNWLERQVDLDMDAKRFAAIQETGVNFRLEIDVPKDGAFLRAGVLDLTSGHTGTLEVPLNQVVTAVQTAAKSK